MTWRETYEKWLNSPALSEEEWKELDAIRDDPKEIEDRFYAPLEFGTAGLRGTMKLGLHNMNVLVTESNGEMVFTRRLMPGPTDKSYGIEVARLAGVPQQVVARAKRILLDLEARARQNGQASPASQVMESLPALPGLESLAEPEAPAAPEEPVCEVPHPLLVSLRDLDPEHLSPLDALKTLVEWKQLWGGKP